MDVRSSPLNNLKLEVNQDIRQPVEHAWFIIVLSCYPHIYFASKSRIMGKAWEAVKTRLIAVRDAPKLVFMALLLLGGYQFLHSFKPSDSYNVQIVEEKNVTNEEYYSDIMPIQTYCTLPATLIQGLIFEFGGYRPALVVEACMFVLGTILTIIAQVPYSVQVLKSAESLYAFSFAAGYMVNCAMFVVLPDIYYSAASRLAFKKEFLTASVSIVLLCC